MWMDFGISGSVPTGRTEKQVETNEMAARLAGDECGVQMGSYPVPDKPRQTVKGSGGPRQSLVLQRQTEDARRCLKELSHGLGLSSACRFQVKADQAGA